MKLIGHVHGQDAYQKIVGLLHSKGIPTFAKFSGAPGHLPTPYRAAVFVQFNHQYADALAVIKDPSHVVSEPIDVEEFFKYGQDQPTSTLIYKWVAIIAITVVLGVVAVFWLTGYSFAETPNNSFKPNLSADAAKSA